MNINEMYNPPIDKILNNNKNDNKILKKKKNPPIDLLQLYLLLGQVNFFVFFLYKLWVRSIYDIYIHYFYNNRFLSKFKKFCTFIRQYLVVLGKKITFKLTDTMEIIITCYCR